MSNTYTLNSISQLHQSLGLPKPRHPLITVVYPDDVQPVIPLQDVKLIINLYQITLKQFACGTLIYGRNSYDYEEGTIIFTSPGQVVAYKEGPEEDNQNIEGWSLCFHPDLIRKSDLGDKINQYNFFNYEVNEALHLSDEEQKTIEEIVDKITKEYCQNLDRHSQHLIVSNLELLLDYCLRYYDRQFYTRTNLNTDVVSKFERLLKAYYQTNKTEKCSIPNVNYFGEKLNLSPYYLSDLLKKETGKSAQEHIHYHLIEKAKNKLLNSSDSVSSIGYDLGFEYPQHFSNLFKAKTGISPRAYRNLD
ncbi:AraC family transcriptional regulator [marine bacterium AO1-C]|nr:AraC family transcriptional regulator [marine bacterium AO1-C]